MPILVHEDVDFVDVVPDSVDVDAVKRHTLSVKMTILSLVLMILKEDGFDQFIVLIQVQIKNTK